MSGTPENKKKNKYKRILAWTFFYIVIFIGFLITIYWQANKVNTLQFPQGEILVSTSKTKYTVGDTINYTITNKLVNSITLIDHCPNEPLHIYEWENYQWVRIHSKENTSQCASSKNYIIKPNKSITFNFNNYPKLFSSPGIYRIVAYADNYTALPYADFEVVAKPAPAPSPVVIYKPVYTPVYTPIYVPTTTSGGDHSSSSSGGDN